MSLKILLQSNAPWVSSGYGSTTRLLANIWRGLGHEVSIFCSFGLEGGNLEYDGFTCLPRGNAQWGSDIIWSHCKRVGSDLVITNIDTFVLQGYGNAYRPWIPIVPIMEDPLVPRIRGSLAGAFSLVSISAYGKRVLQEGGFSSTMIRLPTETGMYYPLDKRQAKASLGFPEDCFLVGNVGMNRGSRKGHDLLLRAFAMLAKEMPNAYLYVHTDTGQPDGIALEPLASNLGIVGRVRFPNRYEAFLGQPQGWMQAMYSAFDLYVQPSTNEGQGMPVWEALSSGLVVAATECTALTEAIEGGDAIGLPVVNKKWMQGEGYAYETSAEHVAQAIYAAYQKWGTGYISAHNRQWAIDNVSLPVIGFQWQDFLISIEKKLRYAPAIQPFTGTRPKIMQIATLVENCGVGAYTRALNNSIGEACDVATMDIMSLQPDTKIAADLIHIQHEPSVAPAHMDEVIRNLRADGHRIAITYHNIDPQLADRHLEGNMVDAIIIHWPPPGNPPPNDPRVHIMGGMGCPSFDPPMAPDEKQKMRVAHGFNEGDFIISTFGFAALGRGHFEVVEELVPLFKSNGNIKIQIVAPANFLNQLGSAYVKQQLDEIADINGLVGRIVYIPDFLPDRQVLERLFMSDLGYLYLGGNTMSSSSAIRFFVSARLPTVITPSSHFGDIRRGVVVTDGYSLPEFASVIRELSFNHAARVRLRNEHNLTYDLWKWPMFGERTLAIYKRILEG